VSALERLARELRAHTGAAGTQVDCFVRAVLPWRERFPAASKLQPEPIL
jgi:hypothetical protein